MGRRDAEDTAAPDFLLGGGEMATLIQSKDWASTPLGPISSWPQSLRTAVSLCLASNFPINLIWGPEHSQIYNDGYRVVCGDAHPRALGESYRDTWASAWEAIGQPFERALQGETSFLENQRMFLTRNGYLEETFFTFSLSPIRGESGEIGGLFHPVTETTATMLGERRTRALRDLNGRLATCSDLASLAAETAATLAAHQFDLPFVLIYGRAPGAPAFELLARQGLADGPGAPVRMEVAESATWPLGEVVSQGGLVTVERVGAKVGGAACGPYPEPPERAIIIPLASPGADPADAVVILGVSPRLPFDAEYQGFFQLLGAALAAALATVRAREDERRRAEALAEIDRAKTAFFSNVSHEFRTPLTLMLGPIEDALGSSSELPAAEVERLQIIHRNGQRLLKLVNTLLDFSRIEAGRAAAQPEPTDLAGYTADVASSFRSAMEAAGLQFEVDVRDLPASVMLDREMWEKVVLNLLSNAFKFTLTGKVTVKVDAVGDQAELVVADTGVGIPDEALPHLFERFHRVEGAGGRSFEGSGIGLALVQELVKLNGGEISVESELGRGSTFRIRLPFSEQPNPVTPAAASDRSAVFVDEALRWLPEPLDDLRSAHLDLSGVSTVGQIQPRLHEAATLEGLETPSLERPRVLLADDNADMRAYVRRVLEAAGYEVRTTARGDEALGLIRGGWRPDLVLSDVMMPGMGGFELVEAIRGDAALEALPVVLLSARAGEEARVEGLSSGADDYLVKPFSARELRARIDGAIRLSRERAKAARRELELHAELATARADARARRSEADLAFALNAGRLGSWDIDLLTDRLTASDIGLANFGLDPTVPYDRQTLVDRIHPEDRARRERQLATAIEERSNLDLEYRVLRPDGAVAWLLMRGRADYADDGTPIRLAGVSLDITERKLAEARQKLLLDELNHRVKNTLASVQSIALQTARGAGAPEALTDVFYARLGALSDAHDLLTRTSWEGVSLEDMLELTLRPYPPQRIMLRGPKILMGPNAAVTLSMAFHELTTNAAKYGALSRPDGQVATTWALDRERGEPELLVEWRERFGPPVSPPSRRGFGIRLLQQGVPHELGGSVKIDHDPEGLVCRMSLPLSSKLTAFAS